MKVHNVFKWRVEPIKIVNTLQLFITNKCNKRCKACFYNRHLNSNEMSFDQYTNFIKQYKENVNKIILMGGEPTLHPDLVNMIVYNQRLGLNTTIYTNGTKLHTIENRIKHLDMLKFRVGVMGLNSSEKRLIDVQTKLPVDIVYMLRPDNIQEMLKTAIYAESMLSCKTFFISSVRDIEQTGSYYGETDDTISISDYPGIVKDFLSAYNGNMDIHVSTRDVVDTVNEPITHCRFLNILPDNKKMICPFEISLDKTVQDYKFLSRQCQVNTGGNCIFQKAIFKRI